MSPLEAALLVIALVLPFHLLVQWQLGRLLDPRHLRRRGVVIRRVEAVQRAGEIIGRYRGEDIHASLHFMGLTYRFDRIAPPRYGVGRRELLLPPGLVYVTD